MPRTRRKVKSVSGRAPPADKSAIVPAATATIPANTSTNTSASSSRPSRNPLLKSRPRLPAKPPLAPPGSGTVKLWSSLRRLWDTVLPPHHALHSLPPALPPTTNNGRDAYTQNASSSSNQRPATNKLIRSSSGRQHRLSNSSRPQSSSSEMLSSRLRFRSTSSSAPPARTVDRPDSHNGEPTSPSSIAVPPSTTTRQFKFPTLPPSSLPRSSSSRSLILARSRSVQMQRDSNTEPSNKETTPKIVSDETTPEEPNVVLENHQSAHKSSSRISNIVTSLKFRKECADADKSLSSKPQPILPPPPPLTLQSSSTSFSPRPRSTTNENIDRPRSPVQNGKQIRSSYSSSTMMNRQRRSSLPSSPRQIESNENITSKNRLRLSATGMYSSEKDVSETDDNEFKSPSLLKNQSSLKRQNTSRTLRHHSRLRESAQKAMNRTRSISEERGQSETEDDSSLSRFRSAIVREAVRASRLKSSRRLSASKMSNSISDTESGSRNESNFSVGNKRSTNSRAGKNTSDSHYSSNTSEENKDIQNRDTTSMKVRSRRRIEMNTSTGKKNEGTEKKDMKEKKIANVVCTLVPSVIVDIPPAPTPTVEDVDCDDKRHKTTILSELSDMDTSEVDVTDKDDVEVCFEIDIHETDLSPQVRPSEYDIRTLHNIRPASHIRHLIYDDNAPLSAPGSPLGGGLFVGFPMYSPSPCSSPHMQQPSSVHGADRGQELPMLTLPENVTSLGSEEIGKVKENSMTRRASVCAVNSESSWIGTCRRLHVDKLVEQRLNNLQNLVTQLRSRQTNKPSALRLFSSSHHAITTTKKD